MYIRTSEEPCLTDLHYSATGITNPKGPRGLGCEQHRRDRTAWDCSPLGNPLEQKRLEVVYCGSRVSLTRFIPRLQYMWGL